MPEETETVTGTPAQEQSTEDQKDNTDANSTENPKGQPSEAQVSVSQENSSQPSVEACILKTNLSSETQSEPPLVEPETSILKTNTSSEAEPQAWSVSSRPKSPEVMATEAFLLKEQESCKPESQPTSKSEPSEPLNEQIPRETNISFEPSQVTEPEIVPQPLEAIEPRTPANSEASESGVPSSGEEQLQESTSAQVVEVYHSSKPVLIAPVEEYTTINGDISEEPPKETKTIERQETAPQFQFTNGQSNGEYKLETRKVPEPEPEQQQVDKPQVLIETIANELIAEDYKLPDVVEVKKHFEYVEPAQNDLSAAPPKKGALSTRLDVQSVKEAYEDVRYDGSETQWAVFKFEGPTIVTSATGSDFTQFKSHFGEAERVFGYIRVQTGDELSKRAKFLLVTWVGPSVSVLKRAKMSTDKALMKGILSNFAVELQTENIADINLQNFVTELDKAAGAHYGTGVRG